MTKAVKFPTKAVKSLNPFAVKASGALLALFLTALTAKSLFLYIYSSHVTLAFFYFCFRENAFLAVKAVKCPDFTGFLTSNDFGQAVKSPGDRSATGWSPGLHPGNMAPTGFPNDHGMEDDVQ